MKTSLILVHLLVSTISTVYGYHILCIQGVPTRSHFNLMYGIVKPLLKDHEVTFATSHPDRVLKTRRLNVIDVSSLQRLYNVIDTTEDKRMDMKAVKQFARNISRGVFESPDVQNALTHTNFDAVVTEWFFSDVEAGYAAVQQVPWILLSGIVMHQHLEHLVDTVRSATTIPDFMHNFAIRMTLPQRIMNTITYLYGTVDNWMDRSQAVSDYESFKPIADARGVPLPQYSAAIHNISILFVNSHPSFAPVQSLPPNVVEIGGYHIDEEIPRLPEDLQQLLDSSTNGVIYFSMGTVFKSTKLSEVNRKNLVKLFGSLPYTVLWKFDGTIDNAPENLYIRSWMPQTSILAHPNTKLFISHCGLLSVIESLKFGVPILAVPLFGDQPSNAEGAVRAGYAIRIPISTDMAADMEFALKEMLSNDNYGKSARYLSNIFRRQLVPPSTLIQHYIELAIETKGAYHLRSKTHLYAWYELWMLDQVAVFAGIIYLLNKIITGLGDSFKKPIRRHQKKFKRL